MKRGYAPFLIFWVVFLLIIGAIGYYVWINYSKTPNESTTKLANSIFKYPSSTLWEIKQSKNLCIQITECSQPINIFLETPDNWSNVYNYYDSYFKENKWDTNRAVITSIPDNVVYTKNLCKIVMENHNDIKYSFAVTCQQK